MLNSSFVTDNGKKIATAATVNDSTHPQSGGQSGATTQVPTPTMEPLVEEMYTDDQDETLRM